MISIALAALTVLVSWRAMLVALDEINTLRNDMWWEHNGDRVNVDAIRRAKRYGSDS